MCRQLVGANKAVSFQTVFWLGIYSQGIAIRPTMRCVFKFVLTEAKSECWSGIFLVTGKSGGRAVGCFLAKVVSVLVVRAANNTEPFVCGEVLFGGNAQLVLCRRKRRSAVCENGKKEGDKIAIRYSRKRKGETVYMPMHGLGLRLTCHRDSSA